MNLSKQLVKQFKEIYLTGNWVVATNLKAQLLDVDWEQATVKIGSLNTIADLVFHLNYYIKGVLDVLKGGTLTIRDKYSFNIPSITSEKDWNTLRTEIINNAQEFVCILEQFSDEELNQVFVDKKYGSYERNIRVTIEHGYYHLGQLVLIKKIIVEKINTQF